MLYKALQPSYIVLVSKAKRELKMATTRLLRTFKPMIIRTSSYSSSSTPPSVEYLNNKGSEKRVGSNKERKQVAVSETLTTLKPQVNQGVVDLPTLVTKANRSLLILLRTSLKPKHMQQQFQMFIEKGIIDCRFFALLAVAGSLLGSVLCFVEGCFMVLESYLKYFKTLSQKTDQGHIMHLLIEAIDMFLVGTALLLFGVGMYAMFMGSNAVKDH